MNRLRRLRIYFKKMFPLHTNVLGCVLMFLSFYLLAQRTGGDGHVKLGPIAILGATSVFLAGLLARLFDEMKDRGVDSQFFPDRPLVTGAVEYADIYVLAAIVGPTLVALNITRGVAAIFFVVFFAFLLLSWRWFFMPKVVPPRLLLVFLTHQPLIPLLHLYVYGVALRDTGMSADPRTAALLILAFWPPMMAWELGRKIRAPEQETEYRTYSKIFGPRGAALGVVACLFFTAGLLTFLAKEHALPTWFAGLEWAVSVGMSIPWIAFAMRPIAQRARLKPWVETYVLCFHLGIIAVCLA